MFYTKFAVKEQLQQQMQRKLEARMFMSSQQEVEHKRNIKNKKKESLKNVENFKYSEKTFLSQKFIQKEIKTVVQPEGLW
jgi:hypothetical protein